MQAKLLTHLAARGASVAGVLGDFHLLDGLTERSTVTGTVLSGNANLFGTLGLNVSLCFPSSLASSGSVPMARMRDGDRAHSRREGENFAGRLGALRRWSGPRRRGFARSVAIAVHPSAASLSFARSTIQHMGAVDFLSVYRIPPGDSVMVIQIIGFTGAQVRRTINSANTHRSAVARSARQSRSKSCRCVVRIAVGREHCRCRRCDSPFLIRVGDLDG